MVQLSPKAVYHNLKHLEEVDVAKSAFYRELAQSILADLDIDLKWRQAIANRLNQANHMLELQTVDNDDSY